MSRSRMSEHEFQLEPKFFYSSDFATILQEQVSFVPVKYSQNQRNKRILVVETQILDMLVFCDRPQSKTFVLISEL